VPLADQWVLTLLGAPWAKIAYALPTAAFNCLGTNVMPLTENGTDGCTNAAPTLTVAPA
jgi:hypothetical protein